MTSITREPPEQITKPALRPDLLYSQACIDWAVAQFPSFKKRIDAWLETNLDFQLREIEANPTHDLLMMVEKELFPLSFSADVSAYINAIRSSLDILATSLAHRHGIPRPDTHYFPVVGSAAEFSAGVTAGKGFKGAEFINQLPDAERSVIESLKPYRGGNDLLWTLHKLNNLSKHRRLLTVDPIPRHLTVRNDPTFTFVSGDGFVKANGETVLGFVTKSSSYVEFSFSAHVTLDEVGIFERKPVLAVLNDFAGLATSIVKLFN